MKRELKIGDSQIITISDNGIVTLPSETKMSISEIAGLFEIYYQTAKRHIRTIEKSGIVDDFTSTGGIVEGLKVYPGYYGLEMIMALSFGIQSKNAEIFRKYVMNKVSKVDIPVILTTPVQNALLN